MGIREKIYNLEDGIDDTKEDIHQLKADYHQLKADYHKLFTEHKKLLHLVTAMADDVSEKVVDAWRTHHIWAQHFDNEVLEHES